MEDEIGCLLLFIIAFLACGVGICGIGLIVETIKMFM